MNKNLFFLYGFSFFRSQMFLLPVLLLFYYSNGLTAGDYFLFQGIMTLLVIFLEIPAGFLSDRTSPKTILTLALIFLIVRAVLWLSCSGYMVVLVGEFLFTLSKSCFDSIVSSYIFTVLKQEGQKEKMNRIYGHLNFFMYLSAALAGIFGAYFYESYGVKFVLLAEISCYMTAFFCLFRLPILAVRRKTEQKSLKLRRIFLILKKTVQHSAYFPVIMYSGLLVGFSNLFFWSFQPLLRSESAAIMSYGAVLFVNNVIRCFCSYYSEDITGKVSFFGLGFVVYILEVFAFFLLLFFGLNGITGLSIFLILFFCLCIGLQLAFTISHISRLHKLVFSPVRSFVSAFNMTVARLFTALLLIAAKFLQDSLTVFEVLMVLTGLILIPSGYFLLQRIRRLQLF